MTLYNKLLSLLLLATTCCPSLFAQKVFEASSFGIRPNLSKNESPLVNKALQKIKAYQDKTSESIILKFAPGEYHFYEKGTFSREYYISNHDQSNPKNVAFALEDLKDFTLDGQGAQFIFHGRILPVSLLNSANCTLKNFSIDFQHPQISQVSIVRNSPTEGIDFEPAPWVKWRITPDSAFQAYDESWTFTYNHGMAFEKETKRIVYRSSDTHLNTRKVIRNEDGTLRAPLWKDPKLVPGTVVVMRGGKRPTPGVFLSENKNTLLQNVRIHYAEGMGLLAQLCEDITLDGFSVCLKENSPRYFTTQADATHFSGCKGKIVSINGLYENMMDDAINVHGTYLKVVGRIDNHTLRGRFMHEQAWGFGWGCVGDTVQFLRSNTMEVVQPATTITAIKPADKPTAHGVREYLITFADEVAAEVSEQAGYGIENLTWTPSVEFRGNTIRNNRARGALFSTPRTTIVADNFFDHTSGAAILLCGDCNGWYETGACRDVQIRHNKFLNALTSLFQFTEAVISIYPEIPNLEGGKQYFHGGKGTPGVVIEDNEFIAFDKPLVYAKSIDGLYFRKNIIKDSTEYPPFHPNQHRFKFEKCTNIFVE